MGQTNLCIFCNLLKKQQEKIIKEDDQFFAFHDINKASAQQHVLVSTKQHLDHALQLHSPQQLRRMHKFGQEVLNELCEGEIRPQYRFGFHLPPFNTVNHVHLHCFVEPFTSMKYDCFHYGCVLSSVESVHEKLLKKGSL